MIANSIQKSTGCGCGGGSSIPFAPCSCGGAGCAACQTQGFIRPRFFAGQLLTEDDLQLLTDYVGQKDRLHNRLLFGAGVVCGLEVTCHPCGDGQVIVHQGYALDCCGNDLVLACAKTLDINAMIRDLRRDQLGGFDCVDPCPSPPTDCMDQADKQSQNAATHQQAATATEQPKLPARKYCLYIHYCEQPSDPVMPYATGDDCGRLVCEPTRVHEGIRFELRCPPTGEASNPLLRRLCECLGDLSTATDLFYGAYKLRQHTASLRSALKEISDGTPLKPVTKEELFAQRIRLQDTVTAWLQSIVPPPGYAFGDRLPVNVSQSVRNETFKLAYFVVRARVLKSKELEHEADATKFMLQWMRDFVNRFFTLPETPENKEFLAAMAISAGELHADDIAVQFLARGAIFHSMTVRAYTPLAERTRDWLLERLDQSPFLTDCMLRQKAKRVELPEIKQQFSRSDASAFTNIHELADLVINYVRDCVCRALNPACAPCNDSAILLACLELDECNVVKICNLERTFVLSPVAMRYWLPPLQLIGNVLEDLCCMPLEKLITDDPDKTINSVFKTLVNGEVFRLLRASLCVKDDNEAKKFIDVSSQLFDSSTSPLGSQSVANLLSPGVETAAVGDQARGVGTSSEPMDAMLARFEQMTGKKVQGILAREPGVAAPTERRAPRRQTKKPPEPKTDPSGGDQQ